MLRDHSYSFHDDTSADARSSDGHRPQIYCAAYESCNPLIIMSLTATVPESTDALLCASMSTCRPVSLLRGLSDVSDVATCDLRVLALSTTKD